MPKLNPEHIATYQVLYAQKKGKEISPAEAQEELMALVCLLDSVHQHMERNKWPDISIGIATPEKYELNE
jgi:hypothetical protein